MICENCKGQLRVISTHPLPGGAVRKRKCQGCGITVYTTEQIAPNGNLFHKVDAKYAKVRQIKRINKRCDKFTRENVTDTNVGGKENGGEGK